MDYKIDNEVEKMQRQAIITSPDQLRKLARELEGEWLESAIVGASIKEVKFQVNIINKTNESDTWEFERYVTRSRTKERWEK